MTLLDVAPYAVAGVVALGAGGYYLHCEHVKKDHGQFVAQLRADAEAQRRGLEARSARETRIKEEADEKALKDRAALERTVKRLRDERARASSVPAAPADSDRPDLACFDRAELARTVGNLEAGVEGLLAEGSAASSDLDVARDWALKLKFSQELGR